MKKTMVAGAIMLSSLSLVGCGNDTPPAPLTAADHDYAKTIRGIVPQLGGASDDDIVVEARQVCTTWKDKGVNVSSISYEVARVSDKFKVAEQDVGVIGSFIGSATAQYCTDKSLELAKVVQEANASASPTAK